MQYAFDFFRDTLRLADAQHPLTCFGGLPLVQQVLDDNMLTARLVDWLPATESNHPHPVDRMISTTVLLQLAGVETLADIRKFHRDGLFHGQAMPSDRCLAGWLARFGTPEGMAALRRLQRHPLQRIVRPGEYVLDLDCAQIRTTKANAQRAYNGESGFWLMAAFLAGVDAMVGDEMRPGHLSRPGGERVVRMLQSALEMLPAGVSAGLVSGDSADYLRDFFAAADELDLQVVVKARRTPAVLAGVSKVAPEASIPFPAVGPDCYLGVLEGHRIGAADAPCRLVYLCRRTTEDRLLGRGGQLRFALAKTLTEDPAEVVRVYRERGEVENRIRELKSGVAAGHLPSARFESNVAWVRIAGGLTDNLGIGLARALFPTQRITVETLRWYVLLVAGRLVTGGRQWTLQLVREAREEMAEWCAILHRRFGAGELLPAG